MTTRLPESDETGAGFVSDVDNTRWSYAGPLTYANAGAVLALAKQMALPMSGEVDLNDVDAIDSAAVAVLLELKRRAAAEHRPLTFVDVPPTLATLADLYGVDQMLNT